VFIPANSSVHAARHWAAPLLSSRFPTEVTDDALLCISELASNAVQHAGTSYEIRLSDVAGRLRISVIDGDVSLVPSSAAAFPGACSETGRGLAIVAAVSTSHGTTVDGDRKVVWCEFGAG